MSTWFQQGVQSLDAGTEQPVVEQVQPREPKQAEAGRGESDPGADISNDILYHMQAELDYHKRSAPRLLSEAKQAQDASREWRSKYDHEVQEHLITSTALNLLLRQTAVEIQNSVATMAENRHLKGLSRHQERGLISLN